MSGLQSAPNFRDVGGAAGPGGRTVSRGVLFRSEALLEPTDADAEALAAHRITLVCDLRSGAERLHAPNRWWAERGVERIEHDLLAGFPDRGGPWAALRRDPGRAGAEEAMRTVYRALPSATRPHLAAIVAALVATPGATLIHCTAGKDRTGFVCAILLTAIGADPQGVMADYLASRGRRTARVADATRRLVQAQVGEVGVDALEALLDVESSYLDTSLEVIAREYGGVDGYLQACGVGAEAVASLRRRLLTP